MKPSFFWPAVVTNTSWPLDDLRKIAATSLSAKLFLFVETASINKLFAKCTYIVMWRTITCLVNTLITPLMWLTSHNYMSFLLIYIFFHFFPERFTPFSTILGNCLLIYMFYMYSLLISSLIYTSFLITVVIIVVTTVTGTVEHLHCFFSRLFRFRFFVVSNNYI